MKRNVVAQGANQLEFGDWLSILDPGQPLPNGRQIDGVGCEPHTGVTQEDVDSSGMVAA